MAYQLFLEYQIMEEKREDFFKQISNLMQTMKRFGIESHHFLESIDKSGLIVEMIEVKDLELARKIKHVRTQEDGILLDLDSHILGGRSKIKCWIFRKFTERIEGICS